MDQAGERAAAGPPQSNLLETMLHTCCHYCGTQVVGPAPALADWKWRHRMRCKHPLEHIHDIFWERWAHSDALSGTVDGGTGDRTRV